MGDDLIILGFPKCGQHALAKYLGCKFHDIIYRPNAVALYAQLYAGKRPVFITRDPESRIRSQYHYFEKYWKNMTLEQFKDYVDPDEVWGGFTPVEQCDYSYHINRFKGFKPLVFRLEDMGSLMKIENRGGNRLLHHIKKVVPFL